MVFVREPCKPFLMNFKSTKMSSDQKLPQNLHDTKAHRDENDKSGN